MCVKVCFTLYLYMYDIRVSCARRTPIYEMTG